jgi:hypothetical protein
VEPGSSLLTGNLPVTLFVSGNFPENNYTCHFGTEETPATILSSSSLQCMVPPSDNADEVPLSLWLGDKPFTNEVPFLYFGKLNFLLSLSIFLSYKFFELRND